MNSRPCGLRVISIHPGSFATPMDRPVGCRPGRTVAVGAAEPHRQRGIGRERVCVRRVW